MKQKIANPKTRIDVALVFAEKFPAEHNEGLLCAIEAELSHCIRCHFRDWCIELESAKIIRFLDEHEVKE